MPTLGVLVNAGVAGAAFLTGHASVARWAFGGRADSFHGHWVCIESAEVALPSEKSPSPESLAFPPPGQPRNHVVEPHHHRHSSRDLDLGDRLRQRLAYGPWLTTGADLVTPRSQRGPRTRQGGGNGQGVGPRELRR